MHFIWGKTFYPNQYFLYIFPLQKPVKGVSLQLGTQKIFVISFDLKFLNKWKCVCGFWRRQKRINSSCTLCLKYPTGALKKETYTYGIGPRTSLEHGYRGPGHWPQERSGSFQHKSCQANKNNTQEGGWADCKREGLPWQHYHLSTAHIACLLRCQWLAGEEPRMRKSGWPIVVTRKLGKASSL